MQEGEEYEESMNKICFKCKTIRSLAVTLGQKIRLVHKWVCPALYHVVLVIPMPKRVVVRL